MDAPYYNGPPDSRRGDTHGTDLTAERELPLYCAECGCELGQVQIELATNDRRFVHLVCSEICRDTLRASLTEE